MYEGVHEVETVYQVGFEILSAVERGVVLALRVSHFTFSTCTSSVNVPLSFIFHFDSNLPFLPVLTIPSPSHLYHSQNVRPSHTNNTKLSVIRIEFILYVALSHSICRPRYSLFFAALREMTPIQIQRL